MAVVQIQLSQQDFQVHNEVTVTFEIIKMCSEFEVTGPGSYWNISLDAVVFFQQSVSILILLIIRDLLT